MKTILFGQNFPKIAKVLYELKCQSTNKLVDMTCNFNLGHDHGYQGQIFEGLHVFFSHHLSSQNKNITQSCITNLPKTDYLLS